MMHMHGVRAQELSARTVGVGLERLVAVPVDVGKSSAMAMVVDFSGRRLAAPFEFALDRAGVARFVARVKQALPAGTALVRVGVKACGHYHRPLVASKVLPTEWQLVEENPAWVSAQRRVNGTGRTKTDPIDLVAIADLLLAGRGYEVVIGDEPRVELSAWVAHRRRRVQARSAVKNQLTGQLDRCFPGLGATLSSVLGTKVGRLIAVEFADPDWLVKLGVSRFWVFAARRDVRVSVTMAERLVAAARDALPTPDAAVARQVLTADLTLLERLDAQLVEVDARIDTLVPATVYGVLTSGPGWGRCVRPATPPGSATRHVGRRIGRCIAPPGSTRPSTSRPGDGVTAASVARGRCRCVGRSWTWAWACGTATPPPAATPPGCANAATRRDHHLRAGPTGEQDRLRDGPRPDPV